MMLKWIMTIAFVISAATVEYISGRTTSDGSRPPYVGCQSSLECMPDHCCAIGPNRFSVPQCKPMQEEGAPCRGSSADSPATLNTTLAYPDGTQINVTNVHYIFCPCSYGFYCDTMESICRDPTRKRGFNHLLGETSTPDD